MPVVWSAVGACALPHLGGILGGFVVKKNFEWYNTLDKPTWTPPKYMFSVVWTSLYTSMGYASYLVWRDGGGFEGKACVPLALYGTQLVLNWAWAPIFFGLRSFKWAKIEGYCLYVTAAAAAVSFYQVNPVASYLMVPYLIWMSIASRLSTHINKNNKEPIKGDDAKIKKLK